MILFNFCICSDLIIIYILIYIIHSLLMEKQLILDFYGNTSNYILSLCTMSDCIKAFIISLSILKIKLIKKTNCKLIVITNKTLYKCLKLMRKRKLSIICKYCLKQTDVKNVSLKRELYDNCLRDIKLIDIVISILNDDIDRNIYQTIFDYIECIMRLTGIDKIDANVC